MCEGGMQASVFLNSPGDCNRQLSKSVNHWLYKPNDELILFFYSFVWLRLVACRILVPRPGIEPSPPVVEARSLNHWTVLITGLPGKSPTDELRAWTLIDICLVLNMTAFLLL